MVDQLKPFRIVVVGGKPIECISASVQKNNRNEQDTATFVLNADILSNEVNNKLMKCNQSSGKVSIEYWSGYVPENNKQNISKMLLKNPDFYKQFLYQRFEGVLDEPEWEYSNQRRAVTLQVSDWTSLLVDLSFTQSVEGADTFAAALINRINALTAPSISIEYLSPSDRLIAASTRIGSESKDKSGKAKYQLNLANRNYFDVLLQVLKYCHFDMVKRGRKIYIGKPIQPKPGKPSPVLSKELIVHDFEEGKHFDSIKIRVGQKGTRFRGDLVVKVSGIHTTKNKKKISSKQVSYTYPDDKKVGNTAEAYFISVNDPKLNSQSACKARAMNIAKQILREQGVTISIDVPNAFIQINPDDGARFFGENLSHIRGKLFRVSSLTENSDENGYKQTIEFEVDIPSEVRALSAPVFGPNQ